MTAAVMARQLFRKAATWAGLGLIAGAYVLIFLQPLPASSWLVAAALNGGLGTALAILGSVVAGYSMASVLDGESC